MENSKLYEIEKKIKELFSASEFSNKFDIISTSIKRKAKDSKTLLADFEIQYKNAPIALIEIKSGLHVPINTAIKFRNDINYTYKRYIATDGYKVYIFDISKNSPKKNLLYFGTDFSQILKHLCFVNEKPPSSKSNESLIINIIHDLCSKLRILKEERLANNPTSNKISYTISDISSAIKILHDEKKIISAFNKTKLKKNIEYILFDLIVDDPWKKDKPKNVFRYSTFDAVFSTLKNLTYRMNGIQGMNDQKEGTYVLQKFYNTLNLEMAIKEGINARLNDIFISSCSLKRDDLTMWRLYSDNSKGISLTIEVDDKLETPFFVKKISYLDGSRDKLIKTIAYAIAQLKELGYSLDSKVFTLIPFFIKNKQYDTEAEIRILFDRLQYYRSQKTVSFDWGISDPYTIARPYIDIKLLKEQKNSIVSNTFLPFKITEIILGPNCPFSKKNVFQIECMLTELGLGKIKILPSGIEKDTYIG